MSYYNIIMVKKSSSQKKGFDEEVYGKMSINQLILFCIYSVNSNEEKCTFERLIKECFTFFPKVFSFINYSNWPDSRKLDRPLRTLRKRKLIKGDPKTFFTLTSQGNQKAKELARLFSQKKLW